MDLATSQSPVQAGGDSPPPAVAAFRARYRSEHIPQRYNGYLHLATTAVVSLGAIAICAVMLHEVGPWEWLTVPITFLYANLVEYAGHRGPMHQRMRGLRLIFRRHACQHHHFFTHESMQYDSSRDFKAVLFPVSLIVFYALAFAAPVGVLLAWLVTANVAALFVATAFGYFLNYELLHFAYHTPRDSWISRIPGMRTLRRLHTRHHDPALMRLCNFNITYPIGDLLFNTLHQPRDG